MARPVSRSALLSVSIVATLALLVAAGAWWTAPAVSGQTAAPGKPAGEPHWCAE